MPGRWCPLVDLINLICLLVGACLSVISGVALVFFFRWLDAWDLLFGTGLGVCALFFFWLGVS